MPYIGKAPSSGIRSRFIYTATAAQTTFTGADGTGKTLGYTDGEYVDVYLNGVLLDPADYTATSKTSVVLDSGATVSDIVEIVVYDTFSVFNGTFTGDLTVDGDTLFVDSTNNRVGIGTTSPQKTLDVTGTFAISNNTSSYWDFDRDDTDGSLKIADTGTERMRIDSSGNVGINTSSPTSYGNSQTALVVEDSGSPAIVLSDTGQTRDWFMVAQGSGLYFNYADGGGAGSASNVTQALYLDSLGKVYIQTTSDTNYGQTSGDSNWMFRSPNGSVIHAQDADDAFSMMYMNKFNWNNTKDSRYINWYKNGATVGSIELTSGGLINYGGTSDYRLKENIVDMTGAIDRIKQAQPKQFNMIDDPDDTAQDGFLAHELATVVPQAVTGTHNQIQTRTNCVRTVNGTLLEENVTEDEWTAGKTDGVYPTDSTWSASWDEPIYQMADYAKLTPLLTAALQEAIAKIETLETQRADLETRLTTLENA